MSCKQLREECRQRGLHGYSQLRKDQLLELLGSGPDPPQSPLKWVGGKKQLLPTLLPILDRYLESAVNYCEPFVGGGSVLLAILSKGVRGKVVANDANIQLINFYQQVQNNHRELTAGINKVCEEYNRMSSEEQKKYYYTVRDKYNQQLTITDRSQAVWFYFLNRAGFRGLYRVGPKGFNVPFGHYKRLNVIDLEPLSKILQPVKFYNLDYQQFYDQVIKQLSGKSLIYYDPPYVPITDTSFTSYTVDGFDHMKFLEHVGQAHTDGYHVVMSNSNSTIITEFAKVHQLSITNVGCRRQIHSTNPGATATEVIITM